MFFRWSIVSPLLPEENAEKEYSRVYSEWDFHCRDCLEYAWSRVRTDEALSSKEVLSLVACLADCFVYYKDTISENAVEVALLRLTTLVKLCLDKGYFSSSKGSYLIHLLLISKLSYSTE